MARPRRELTPDEIARVEELAGRGLTVEQIAECLDLTERTLFRRIADDEAVMAGYRKGKALAIAAVTETVYKKAVAGEGAFPFFYLKTQAGWRETNRTEVTGADGGPIETRLSGISAADWLETEVNRLVAREGTPGLPETVPSEVRRNGGRGH